MIKTINKEEENNGGNSGEGKTTAIPSEYLSLPEAVEIYHIPINTLRRLIREGKFHYYPISYRVRLVKRTDLEKYIASIRKINKEVRQ